MLLLHVIVSKMGPKRAEITEFVVPKQCIIEANPKLSKYFCGFLLILIQV
jgi:hypothetical protein